MYWVRLLRLGVYTVFGEKSVMLFIGGLLLFHQVAFTQGDKISLVTGRVIDTVYCNSYPDQSYALMLPSTYDPVKRWPLVFIFDPGARGLLAAENFKQASERFGSIVMCSNNSSNDSHSGSLVSAKAMFDDAFQRFSVDTSRLFVSGFSGGSRFVSYLALQDPSIKGIIACGAGIHHNRNTPTQIRENLNYYGIIGRRDFNLPDMIETEKSLSNQQVSSFIQYIENDHVWPPAEEITTALAWLFYKTDQNDLKARNYFTAYQMDKVQQLVKQELFLEAVLRLESLMEDFFTPELDEYCQEIKERKAYKRQIARDKRALNWETGKRGEYLEVLTSYVYSTPSRPDTIHTSLWWKKEIHLLQKWEDSNRPELSYAASRLLYTLEVHIAEDIEVYIKERQLLKASFLAELWLEISPHKIWTLWNTSRVYALMGNKEVALELVTRIVDSGEASSSWFDGAGEFDFLRSDPEFSMLLLRMEK